MDREPPTAPAVVDPRTPTTTEGPTSAPVVAASIENTEAFRGLVASRFRPWLVALWSRTHVTFVEGLRAPLPAGYVPTVASFDSRHRLHLVDDAGTLVTVAFDGTVATRRFPRRGKPLLLTATRRHLLWVAAPAEGHHSQRAWRSTAGRFWRRVTLPSGGNAGLELSVGLDGGVQLMTGWEAACGGGGQQRELGRPDHAFVSAPWPLDAPYDWLPGHRGWAYGRADAGECGLKRGGICAVRSKPTPLEITSAVSFHALRSALQGGSPPEGPGDRPPGDRPAPRGGARHTSPRAPLEWPIGPRADNGRQLLVTVEHQLLQLDGPRGRLIPAPVGTTAVALDAANRPLALAAGRLWRFADGWGEVSISAQR